MRASQLFWLIFALGILVRTSMLVVFRIPLTIEFAEMEKIARSLATDGTFADPYLLPTGSTAHHAPAYPFLLSLVFRVWGYGTAAAFAMAVMNFVFVSFQWALMPLIAERASLPRLVGMVTALVGTLLPYRFLKEIRWEATLVGAAIALLVFITLRWWQSRNPSLLHTLGIGAAWGVGMMCSANLLPVFPLAMAFVVIRSTPHARSMWLRHAAVATVGMLVAIAPWAIRNYLELHGLVFMRSNFGIEFSVSNNPEAYVLSVDNYQIGFPNNHFHLHHPWSNKAEASEVARLGEIAYNRRRVNETFGWIRDNPRRFASLTARRFAYFWLTPYRTQAWKNFVLTPWTILAIYGLVLMVHRGFGFGWLIAALWIGYPLVYYVVQTDTRYRYPIEWTFTLLAVYAVDSLVNARRSAAWSGTRVGRQPAAAGHTPVTES
jgi:hypothetical protein